MHWLSKLLGHQRRRIRKQSSDLTPADFKFSKVWEGCLDEEGVEGQDESTVRARPDLTIVDDPFFDGCIACEACLPSGRRLSAVVWLTLVGEPYTPADT